MFDVRVKFDPPDLTVYLTKRAPDRIYAHISKRMYDVANRVADAMRDTITPFSLTGGLRSSVRVERDERGYEGLWEVVVTGDESGYPYARADKVYAGAVEEGFPNQPWPPPEPLIAWATLTLQRHGALYATERRNGRVRIRALTPRQFAYLVAQKLALEGMRGKFYAQQAIERVRDQLPDRATRLRQLASELVAVISRG